MEKTEYSESIILSHIDKAYSTLTKSWDIANTMLASGIIISCVLIMLSSGFLSLDKQFEFQGFVFQPSSALSFFMITGSFAISYCIFMYYAQDNRSSGLQHEIIRLYKIIGYNESSIANEVIGPFQSPIVAAFIGPFMESSKTSRKIWLILLDMLRGIIFILLIVGLPLTAEFTAGLKMLSLFGYQWWVLLSFIVSILILLIGLATFVSREPYARSKRSNY